MSVTGNPDLILQNGESTTAYVYDNRSISVKEIFKERRVMPPHQQRVVDEHADLRLKTDKLAAFLGTPTYCGLPDAEQARLVKQLEVMNMYCRILIQRIQEFATV